MKHSFSFFISLFVFLTTNGQSSLVGEYREYPTPDNYFQSCTLKLKCDNTFFRQDSIVTAYGKWTQNKNSELVLSFDSVIAWGQTDYRTAKVKYNIIEKRIYRKSVSKKEYNDLVRAGRRKLPRGTGEGFENFKKRELNRYFEKVLDFECKPL